MRRRNWLWITPLGMVIATVIVVASKPKTNGPDQTTPLPPTYAYSAAQLSTCHDHRDARVTVKLSGSKLRVSIDAPVSQQGAVKQAVVFQGNARSISWGVSDERLVLCVRKVTLTSGVTFSKELIASGGQYSAPAGATIAQLVFEGHYTS